ncbi:response regulator transcription factor [Humibacter soli]
MSGRIRVALVDDQALFRAGVRMLIESQPDLEFAGEAANGREAVQLAQRERPDVLLMDVRMPVLDGVSATSEIVARASGTTPRVLVLTTFDVDESAARAIQAGASGFVLKDADPEFLLAAIRTVHAGNAVIAASATRRLLEQFATRERRRTPPELDTLTARERQIFDLAARALSNSEIAEHEYLSEATVKTHISRVLAKLGLRDRVQLVAYAYENGLVA